MGSSFPIRIDGVEVEVENGTTLAAALINNGVWRFRIAVAGEPRAPLCAMGICFECCVTVDGQPHRRSCLIVCRPGMEIRTGG